MARTDSDREYRRWRVEHARNPETESTPRSAAADTAGESLLSQKLGYEALQIVKEHSAKLALKLTRRPGTLKKFGGILLEWVDTDEIPSRMEIHRTLIDKGTVEPNALVSDQVESHRRELLLEQIGEKEIIAIAMTLCQGERDSHDSEAPLSTIIKEHKKDAAALMAKKKV